MKKLLFIILTVIFGFSLFACTDTSNSQNNKDLVPSGVTRRGAIDTFIQDDNGVDKCFWEDGKVQYDDYIIGSYKQTQKNATLSIQTEYDMWFNLRGDDLDLKKYFAPVEFQCDEAKIEIVANPDKENHFILKVLQPCDNEEIVIVLTTINTVDGSIYSRDILHVTISTDE